MDFEEAVKTLGGSERHHLGFEEDLGVMMAHFLSKGEKFSKEKLKVCELMEKELGLDMMGPAFGTYIAGGLAYFAPWRPDGAELMERAKIIRKQGLCGL